MSMQGKVIAITGGASGIGLATAKLLLSRGAIVCIGDIIDATLESAKSELSDLKAPGDFAFAKLDVTSRADVDAWINGIVKDKGRLDGAANCAGIIGKQHGITRLTELEDEEWDRILSVNLTGLMYSLRAELRVISDHGSIVNVASIQGVLGIYSPTSLPLPQVSPIPHPEKNPS